jgi:hypothetical protein
MRKSYFCLIRHELCVVVVRPSWKRKRWWGRRILHIVSVAVLGELGRRRFPRTPGLHF